MKYFDLLRKQVGVLLGFATLTACTSEVEDVLNEGKGYVSLSLSMEEHFKTRAAAEDDYQNTANYTVQIWQADQPVSGCEWPYPEVPASIELKNGSYVLKAFYGEDKAVSDKAPFVKGEKAFEVNNDLQKVAVECALQSAKVAVAFDSTMNDYFSDYSVEFKTKAMANGAVHTWAKKDAGKTYYFLVGANEKVDAVMHLTDAKTGKSTQVTMNVTLSPGSNKQYTLKPHVEEGTGGTGLGIEITIDSSTNDKEYEITIPSDWI